MRALEHAVHEAGASRREEFPGGVAYFNDELPAVWDVNFLRLDGPCPDPAAEADRLQGAFAHRKVLIEDPELAARFRPALRRRGFGERALLALARPPGGRVDADVRELPYDDVRELRRQILSEQLVPYDPAVVEQLIEAGAHFARAGGRWLALSDAGRLAGHCVLYSREGLAQIEDVAVLAADRGRGLSRRLIEHALELVAADHDAVFIQAERDEWPAAFYRRLGFEPVEERADFLLTIT